MSSTCAPGAEGVVHRRMYWPHLCIRSAELRERPEQRTKEGRVDAIEAGRSRQSCTQVRFPT